jgi:hypothetical protein
MVQSFTEQLIVTQLGKTVTVQHKVTNLRRKKFQMTCVGITPSLPLETKAWSLCVQGDIFKK